MVVVSIKDYAAEKGVSYEAVRQQVVRYKEELEGHIIRDGRQQFLDAEAVAFLDAKRQKSPVAIIQQDKNEQIRELEQQVKALLAKTADQADCISRLSQWKADNALVLAEATQTRLLLDNTRAELTALKREGEAREKAFTQELADVKARAQQETQQARQEAAEAVDRADRLDRTLEKVQDERDTAEQDNKRLEDENHLLRQEVEQLRKHPLKCLVKDLFGWKGRGGNGN